MVTVSVTNRMTRMNSQVLTQSGTDFDRVLDDFDGQWMYFYEILFRRLFKNNRNSLVGGYLLFVIIWGLVTLGTDRVYGASLLFSDWWWYYVGFCTSVFSAVILLNLAKRRLRKNLSFVLGLMPDIESQEVFLRHIKLMGNSSKQVLFCASFGLLGFIIVLFQQFIQIVFAIKLYSAIATFIALTFSGCGLWLAVTSIRMIKWLSDLTMLRLDFLNPAKTKGILAMSSLMAFYSSLFAIQVILWEAPYLAVVLTAPSRIPFLDLGGLPFFISTSMFVVFLPFILVYFLYPQLKISSLVEKQRDRTLLDIQTRIYDIFCEVDTSDSDRASLLGEYLSLYKEVEKSKGSLSTKDLIGFSASFTTSLVLFVVGNFETIMKLAIN